MEEHINKKCLFPLNTCAARHLTEYLKVYVQALSKQFVLLLQNKHTLRLKVEVQRMESILTVALKCKFELICY